MLRIDVESRHVFPCDSPVMTHFVRGTVRQSVGHKQRDQDDAEGCYGERCEEAFFEEGFAPYDEIARQLGGGQSDTTGGSGHCHRHVGHSV
jgi:hypothetical protein